MKKLFFAAVIAFLSLTLSYAKDQNLKFILLISEQNIAGPQRAWWASEIDLSATETTIAKKLIAQGYAVIQPALLTKQIKKNPAFRKISLSAGESIKLGSLSKADYVVLGKAVASSGGNVPQSNMRSCFANVSAQLIRIKDAKVIAYLDAAGNSAHLDMITGGKEALVNAAENLSIKLMDSLNKERGK